MSVCKNNEITLKINKELEDLIEVLENNGFKVKEKSFTSTLKSFLLIKVKLFTINIKHLLEKNFCNS